MCISENQTFSYSAKFQGFLISDDSVDGLDVTIAHVSTHMR